MSERQTLVVDAVIVEQELRFSFSALCQATRGSESQLRALVDEGILVPTGVGPADWEFHGAALRTARTALRLGGDFGLGADGVALVLELLAENDALRARLQRAGLA